MRENKFQKNAITKKCGRAAFQLADAVQKGNLN